VSSLFTIIIIMIIIIIIIIILGSMAFTGHRGWRLLLLRPDWYAHIEDLPVVGQSVPPPHLPRQVCMESNQKRVSVGGSTGRFRFTESDTASLEDTEHRTRF
jgi:hypothetical protein